MPALVIGRQVPATINPINVYRVASSQMSGDADSYNEESIDDSSFIQISNFHVLVIKPRCEVKPQHVPNRKNAGDE